MASVIKLRSVHYQSGPSALFVPVVTPFTNMVTQANLPGIVALCIGPCWQVATPQKRSKGSHVRELLVLKIDPFHLGVTTIPGPELNSDFCSMILLVNYRAYLKTVSMNSVKEIGHIHDM